MEGNKRQYLSIGHWISGTLSSKSDHRLELVLAIHYIFSVEHTTANVSDMKGQKAKVSDASCSAIRVSSKTFLQSIYDPYDLTEVVRSLSLLLAGQKQRGSREPRHIMMIASG